MRRVWYTEGVKLPRRTGEYRLHQWANDWLSADEVETGRPIIASPRGAKLTDEEAERLREDYNEFLQLAGAGLPNQHHAGVFWLEWCLDGNTLRKR